MSMNDGYFGEIKVSVGTIVKNANIIINSAVFLCLYVMKFLFILSYEMKNSWIIQYLMVETSLFMKCKLN